MDEKKEVERVIRLLRTVIRLLGFTNREIERRLGLTPSYLTRLFGGAIELRYEHVLGIGRALGLKPNEIFEVLYPRRDEERSEAAVRLHHTLKEMSATPIPEPAPPSGVTLDQVDERIRDAMRTFFADLAQKGRG
jgi:transcriptional regulator with XRE-family HTH domain